MNILFVIPSFHTNLFYALKALKEAGYRTHLVCAKNREGADDVASTHTVVDEDRITLREVRELLGHLDPNIVIIRKTGCLSKLMYRASILQRRKMIGYDQRPYLRPRHIGQVLHGTLNGRPMCRFTPVHGLPGSGRPDPRATYLPFPVEAMPDGGTRDYAPGGTARILCVAKLTERRKNHFLLLKALEPLAAQFNFRVTLVGSSSLDIQNPDQDYFNALQDYAMNGPLAGRVTIQPDVPFDDMTAIYRSHDICVLPSRAEPLGTAPLEAMAQGSAAVISSEAGSAYYVQSGEEAGLPCGAVFPGSHENALREALAGIMATPETLRTLGRNAAQWTRMEFCSEEFVNRFEERLIRSLSPKTELASH